MTIQKMIFLLKEDGWSDEAVRVGVCVKLFSLGYTVTALTRLVIEQHLRNYAQFVSGAN